MLKKIILGIIVIILAGGLLWFLGKKGAPSATQNENIEKPEESSLTPELPQPTLPFSNDPKDVAWNLFQKYLAYNKARDFEGVKSVVYKIAAVCANPQTRIDCEARMNAAYQYGSVLKKENFVNIWTDEKQIILTTDFWVEDSDDMDLLGRFRSIIFFVKDSSDQLKLLSFTPQQGGATGKGTASQEELNDRILRWTEDGDNDGIADYTEECLGITEGQVCNKTSPKERDTDGDGWWDGADALLNK